MYDDGDPSSDLGPSCMASEPTSDDQPKSPANHLIWDVVTHCPKCGKIHLDEGEWYNRPHKTHLCQHCGELWRYAEVYTRGVATLGPSSDDQTAPAQTGQECKDLNAEPSNTPTEPGPDSGIERTTVNVEALTSDIPPPKRYAHHGKRRRKFTEELFRCAHVDKISRSDLVCNSLLWKNRPDELRAHLHEHLTVDEIGKMTDDDVKKWYVDAKRIFLQGIPEDLEEGDEDDEQD